jgi:transcription elongation factor Elf1
MDKTAPIRHLYSCPSCHGETWHTTSVATTDRFGLTCLACGLTSLLTHDELLDHQQSWEKELDEAMQKWEESWQSPPPDFE